MKMLTLDASFELARVVARACGVSCLHPNIITFADGENEIRLPDPEYYRDEHVVIIQSTSPPVNERCMQLAFTIHALKNAGARTITAIIPYLGYSRHEESAQFSGMPGEAGVIAGLFEVAGLDRLCTVALHSGDVADFFSVPVVNHKLSAFIAEHIMGNLAACGVAGPEQLCLVSPDAGGADRVRAIAQRIGCSFSVFSKVRYGPDKTRLESTGVLDRSKTVIIIDDIIDTGGTIVHAADALHGRGVKTIFAWAVHPVFSANALERIDRSCIKSVFVTDSIPCEYSSKKIEVVSIAQVLVTMLREDGLCTN